MNSDDELLTRIVSDVLMVATHVASQPWGYAGFEVEQAKYLLHTVDVVTLEATLRSVLFVSNFLQQHSLLTKAEGEVEQAALRLHRLQRSIRARRSDIQARMAA
jgi:hypothetical protein